MSLVQELLHKKQRIKGEAGGALYSLFFGGWGEEEFAGAGVAGGLEFGHEGFVAVDLAGKELARSGFATVGEIGHS